MITLALQFDTLLTLAVVLVFSLVALRTILASL